jgi:hypothetical protein
MRPHVVTRRRLVFHDRARFRALMASAISARFAVAIRID